MSTITKSTTLELTINADYVRTWGLWEAVRELVQNGLDAHDNGHPLTLTRGGGETKTIHITTEGTTLTRDTLLLGCTTKADNSARGKFGEGYKLALLVLARSGIEVQIRTGQEMWTPHIERSEAFGSELLKIKIRPQAKFINAVDVQIHGIDDETWTSIRQRIVLPTETEDAAIKCGQDKLYVSGDRRGYLYNRGLMVTKLPGEWTYGFDLYSVELDRDRKAPDYWSLRTGISCVIKTALASNRLKAAEVYDMLAIGGGEAATLVGALQYACEGDALAKALAGEFVLRHGTEAVACKSSADATEAHNFAMKGVVVSDCLRFAMEAVSGDFAKRKDGAGLKVKETIQLHDLTETEVENLTWALDLCRPVADCDTVTIVTFINPLIRGMCQFGKGIFLNRLLLTDRKALMGVLIHELAHQVSSGADGSPEHCREMENLFSEVICRNALS